MMGAKKLATIRDELRAALAAEKSNPIAALDRKIRKLSNDGNSSKKPSPSHVLLRNVLVQVAQEAPRTRARAGRLKQAKRAIKTR